MQPNLLSLKKVDTPLNMGPFGGINSDLSLNNLIPPQLELNKSTSSYTYATKKARKQHWLSHFKSNRKIGTEMLLKGYDLRKEPKSFLLTIKGVSLIPIQEVLGGSNQANLVGSKFSLEYYITLFNKDIGTLGSFYGKTHRSQSIPLRESGGTWEAQQEEFIYFHTSYTEKSSFGVIECVIVRDF